MDPAKQLKAAGPVVDRVLSDKRVQDQLVEAGDHLQQVYRLVSRRKAKAAEDKRVYDHVRRGVVALRKAGETATEPRRPPIGKVLVLALVAGAGAAALAKQERARSACGWRERAGGERAAADVAKARRGPRRRPRRRGPQPAPP